MDQLNFDKRVFEFALSHLHEIVDAAPGGIDQKQDSFEKQIKAALNSNPKSLSDIYGRMISSCMNANMLPSVIPKHLIDLRSPEQTEASHKLDALRTRLFDFNPHKIAQEFKTPKELAKLIVLLDSQEQAERGLLNRFLTSMISSANFLCQFKDHTDFSEFVDRFNQDDRTRVAAPLLIQAEVHGMGFALACDFLKELGYLEFGKPDTHIQDIFVNTGLCDQSGDLPLFRAIQRIARNCDRNPYTVDKIFWLIGTGDFFAPIGWQKPKKEIFINNCNQAMGRRLVRFIG